MGKIKFCLVGLGRIGSGLEEDALREKPCTHTGAIVQNNDAILWGGCDIDIQKCQSFSEKWNCTSVFTNLDKMLVERKPDVLVIATPPETHLEIIEQAIFYKIKVIICEKPLASKINDARKIVRLAHTHKLKILTNHERRYSLDYIQVKNHVECKKFGELLSIVARLYMGETRDLDHILLHDGTHLIDILQFMTSLPLKKVSSQRYKIEQSESILVSAIVSRNKNKDMLPILIEVGNGRNFVVFELDLVFSKGRIRIGNGLYEEYQSQPSPYYEKMNSLALNGAQRPALTGYFYVKRCSSLS
jgi:predicted dehydrogenase